MTDTADFTERVVPRSAGRNVVDLIATHRLDGKIGMVDLLFDGTKVEGVCLIEPDPETGEEGLVPIAIVVDDDLAGQLQVWVPPADPEEEVNDG